MGPIYLDSVYAASPDERRAWDKLTMGKDDLSFQND